MTTTEKKVLNTIFASDTAKKTISVDDPLDTLDAEIVSTNMDAIVGLNNLCDNQGNPVTVAYSANITTTTVQELF